MTTHLANGPTPAAILPSVDAALDSGATLALAFCSPAHDLDALRQSLAERGLDVVGVTTAGEIAGPEIVEGGVSVQLWNAAPGTFAVWSGTRADGETAEDVAARLGRAAVERFADPVVVAFASGVTTDGEAVVRGVRAGAGREVPLFGGLAGDDLRMIETRVASSHETSSDGVVGLILDGARYDVAGLATSGWQAVGIEKTVTRSAGNVVFELDGESVLDVYRDYFDLDDLGTNGSGVVTGLGVQFPLSVRREDGTSVIRAPLVSDPETEGLVFAGAVPEGGRVRFCVPPSLDAVERVLDEAAAFRDRSPVPDAVLLVSCKARHTAFGPIAEDEVAGLAAVWDAPLAGYFSYGEIGSQAGGVADFHNETCSLVTVRERAEAR